MTARSNRSGSRCASNSPDAVILFTHHPPVDLGLPWLDRIGLEGKELLHELLAEEARIRLVCSGHVHHESSHRVGAAEIVTTPSTGLQFSPDEPRGGVRRRSPGYRLVELDGDGYTTRVVRLPEARYSPTR